MAPLFFFLPSSFFSAGFNSFFLAFSLFFLLFGLSVLSNPKRKTEEESLYSFDVFFCTVWFQVMLVVFLSAGSLLRLFVCLFACLFDWSLFKSFSLVLLEAMEIWRTLKGRVKNKNVMKKCFYGWIVFVCLFVFLLFMMRSLKVGFLYM